MIISDIVDTSQDGMEDIVNKLKKYWGQLSDSNKTKNMGILNHFDKN